jgi:tRNA C32,U32 (ribose-2'-O)-methylase TrmJ
MQNFGVYDLRLVNPGPFVLAGPSERPPEADARQTQQSDAHLPDDRGDAARFSVPDGANARGGVNSGASLGPDGLGFGDDVPEALRPTLPNAPPFQEEGNPDAVAPLCREAYRFACAADWLLADASRHETHLDAIADCTFVMATTARPRGNVPLVTARVAAAMVVEEAKRGKVAVLFGNERTGLTNEELAQAHACVAIPTAGRGSLCRKSLKYTGGTGPTSLNVSQAVGVLAYEIFMAADADKSAGEPEHASAASGSIGIPKAQLMTVGEKHVLKNELIAARRTLDVLAGDDVPLSRREGDIEEDVGEDYSDDREALGVERVLNAAPLQRRDAAALFQLARRVRAVSAGESLEGPLDAKVMRVVTSLDGETEAKPTVKRTRAKIREVLGVSLTDKEISKAIRRARRG